MMLYFRYLVDPNLCHDLHCQNDGLCDHINGRPVCVCRSGFRGESCENSNHLCPKSILMYEKVFSRNICLSLNKGLLLRRKI